jgi:hypothetical protein
VPQAFVLDDGGRARSDAFQEWKHHLLRAASFDGKSTFKRFGTISTISAVDFRAMHSMND